MLAAIHLKQFQTYLLSNEVYNLQNEQILGLYKYKKDFDLDLSFVETLNAGRVITKHKEADTNSNNKNMRMVNTDGRFWSSFTLLYF